MRDCVPRLEGFEPPTVGLEIRCSILLSYRRIWKEYKPAGRCLSTDNPTRVSTFRISIYSSKRVGREFGGGLCPQNVGISLDEQLMHL